MSVQGIFIYTLRAAAFAAAVCAVYVLICRCRRRELRWKRMLGIAYIAALVQITVLRGGVDWIRIFEGGRTPPLLIPLHTTLSEFGRGVWPFIYHALGNMIWFVPLGWILRRRGAKTALLTGACLSLSIELLQFLLMTGVADIDDVILNSLGTLFGWGMGELHRN